MSHFYGFLNGNRGETTRCGSKCSGIHAHIRSWTNDVKASISDYEGKDLLQLQIPDGMKVEINGTEFDLEVFNKRHQEDRVEEGI